MLINYKCKNNYFIGIILKNRNINWKLLCNLQILIKIAINVWQYWVHEQ